VTRKAEQDLRLKTPGRTNRLDQDLRQEIKNMSDFGFGISKLKT